MRSIGTPRAWDPEVIDQAIPLLPKTAEREVEEGAGGEPPIELGPEALRVWRGEKPVLTDVGRVDRSRSLVYIGRVVYDAGGTRPLIVRTLRERDEALGWRKYAGRSDAEQRYHEIVDELEKNGRSRRVRTTVGGGGARGGVPTIQTNNRHLRDVTANSLEALQAANDPPEMFVRAGALVRVREDEHGTPQIQHMELNHVRGRLARVADFVKISKQGEEFVETKVSPPEIVVKDLMALSSWPFPALEAVVESPILRPDGSVSDTPGYDSATRLYYRPLPGFECGEIPAEPARGQIRAAMDLVNEAVGEFPYADKASAANTLGLVVTSLIRQAIDGPTPLGLIDAPQAGTGKSLLAEIVAIVGTGRAGEMLGASRDDEEWRKAITAKLVGGSTLVIVDNVEGRLSAPSLARALTSRTWTDRVLGRSEVATVKQRATWAATGNNISLGGDLARRCYWIRLDAKQSRPWQREGFKHPDLTAWARETRGELVASVLAIARAWYAAGKPKAEGIPRLGGFEAWSETIGGILAFAGVGGFLGNLEELYDKADDSSAEWEAFLEEWWRQLGEDSITGKALAKLITEEKPLREALPGDLSEALDKGEGSFTRKLGKALSKHAGTRYGDDGFHISEAGEERRAKLWRVQDSSGTCEFVSFVSLYNPSASKNDCNDSAQTEAATIKSRLGGAETNSPNSQTHTPSVGGVVQPKSSLGADRVSPTIGETLEKYLDEPPNWLGDQLARYAADPGRWLGPTSSAIAQDFYGTASRAPEVVPALRRYLEKGGE